MPSGGTIRIDCSRRCAAMAARGGARSAGRPGAVSPQSNGMTHAIRAPKERGAKIAAVDVYMNGTMEQADLPVLIRPGTDGALACAVMHCLFRDGRADHDYLARYTDAPEELAAHVHERTPAWASRITGCDVATIEAF